MTIQEFLYYTQGKSTPYKMGVDIISSLYSFLYQGWNTGRIYNFQNPDTNFNNYSTHAYFPRLYYTKKYDSHYIFDRLYNGAVLEYDGKKYQLLDGEIKEVDEDYKPIKYLDIDKSFNNDLKYYTNKVLDKYKDSLPANIPVFRDTLIKLLNNVELDEDLKSKISDLLERTTITNKELRDTIYHEKEEALLTAYHKIVDEKLATREFRMKDDSTAKFNPERLDAMYNKLASVNNLLKELESTETIILNRAKHNLINIIRPQLYEMITREILSLQKYCYRVSKRLDNNIDDIRLLYMNNYIYLEENSILPEEYMSVIRSKHKNMEDVANILDYKETIYKARNKIFNEVMNNIYDYYKKYMKDFNYNNHSLDSLLELKDLLLFLDYKLEYYKKNIGKDINTTNMNLYKSIKSFISSEIELCDKHIKEYQDKTFSDDVVDSTVSTHSMIRYLISTYLSKYITNTEEIINIIFDEEVITDALITKVMVMTKYKETDNVKDISGLLQDIDALMKIESNTEGTTFHIVAKAIRYTLYNILEETYIKQKRGN